VGGCASPYFLESAAAIQKAVKAGECSNREDLPIKRNDKEVVEKSQTKKDRRFLSNTVAYGKQLELDHARGPHR
jgi:hypothetical protein